MKIIIFAAIVALTGCATNDRGWSWYKASSSQQDYNIDNGQCRAQGFGVPGASMLQAGLVYHGCMEGKGWEKRDN